MERQGLRNLVTHVHGPASAPCRHARLPSVALRPPGDIGHLFEGEAEFVRIDEFRDQRDVLPKESGRPTGSGGRAVARQSPRRANDPCEPPVRVAAARHRRAGVTPPPPYRREPTRPRPRAPPRQRATVRLMAAKASEAVERHDPSNALGSGSSARPRPLP